MGEKTLDVDIRKERGTGLGWAFMNSAELIVNKQGIATPLCYLWLLSKWYTVHSVYGSVLSSVCVRVHVFIAKPEV